MPDTLKEKGEDPFHPWLSEIRLFPASGGGFRLDAAGGGSIEVGASREGKREVVAPGTRGWTLRETVGREVPGFVLETGEPDDVIEIARSARGGDPGFGPAALHLDDGRVFRVVPRIGSDSRYELHGWEVRGAYWMARYGGAHWMLSPTAAGRRLQGTESLLLLFAAEVLVAEPSPEN